jgi:hypothetical protein
LLCIHSRNDKVHEFLFGKNSTERHADALPLHTEAQGGDIEGRAARFLPMGLRHNPPLELQEYRTERQEKKMGRQQFSDALGSAGGWGWHIVELDLLCSALGRSWDIIEW